MCLSPVIFIFQQIIQQFVLVLYEYKVWSPVWSSDRRTAHLCLHSVLLWGPAGNSGGAVFLWTDRLGEQVNSHTASVHRQILLDHCCTTVDRWQNCLSAGLTRLSVIKNVLPAVMTACWLPVNSFFMRNCLLRATENYNNLNMNTYWVIHVDFL